MPWSTPGFSKTSPAWENSTCVFCCHVVLRHCYLSPSQVFTRSCTTPVAQLQAGDHFARAIGRALGPGHLQEHRRDEKRIVFPVCFVNFAGDAVHYPSRSGCVEAPEHVNALNFSEPCGALLVKFRFGNKSYFTNMVSPGKKCQRMLCDVMPSTLSLLRTTPQPGCSPYICLLLSVLANSWVVALAVTYENKYRLSFKAAHAVNPWLACLIVWILVASHTIDFFTRMKGIREGRAYSAALRCSINGEGCDGSPGPLSCLNIDGSLPRGS